MSLYTISQSNVEDYVSSHSSSTNFDSFTSFTNFTPSSLRADSKSLISNEEECVDSLGNSNSIRKMLVRSILHCRKSFRQYHTILPMKRSLDPGTHLSYLRMCGGIYDFLLSQVTPKILQMLSGLI